MYALNLTDDEIDTQREPLLGEQTYTSVQIKNCVPRPILSIQKTKIDIKSIDLLFTVTRSGFQHGSQVVLWEITRDDTIHMKGDARITENATVISLDVSDLVNGSYVLKLVESRGDFYPQLGESSCHLSVQI